MACPCAKHAVYQVIKFIKFIRFIKCKKLDEPDNLINLTNFVACALRARAAAKVSLATVYQKHSSLLTGNRMYRG